jgi:hypothetical protein
MNTALVLSPERLIRDHELRSTGSTAVVLEPETRTGLGFESKDPAVTMAISDVGPYRQWNPSAVACYLRKANCNGCFYQKFFEDKPYGCHMASAVQYLLNQVGAPDKKRIQRLV